MRIKSRTRARIGLVCAVVSSLVLLAVVAGMLAGHGVNHWAFSSLGYSLCSVIAGISTYRAYRGRP